MKFYFWPTASTTSILTMILWKDRSPLDREPYWDDVFPHELLGYAPYDGILVSKAIVGGHRVTGKYSESQAMRFRRVGGPGIPEISRGRLSGFASLR